MEQCSQKEKVKADLIRKARFHEAALLQGEIDGIAMWWRTLEQYISDLRELRSLEIEEGSLNGLTYSLERGESS